MICALNGAKAIQLLSEGLKPDSILMDIEMPGMSGIEASTFIKKEIDPNIPIIINSGMISFENKLLLYGMGIYDYLEKPYTQKDIYNKLLKNINRNAPVSL